MGTHKFRIKAPTASLQKHMNAFRTIRFIPKQHNIVGLKALQKILCKYKNMAFDPDDTVNLLREVKQIMFPEIAGADQHV